MRTKLVKSPSQQPKREDAPEWTYKSDAIQIVIHEFTATTHAGKCTGTPDRRDSTKANF